MKVAFLDTVHPVLQERLEAAGFTCLDFTQTPLNEIKTALKDVQGIVIRSRFPMNSDVLDHAPELQFIARSGAGMENIEEDYCAQRNIQLFNAPEGNRNAVGEHALGGLLALFNKICTANLEVNQGIWNREGNRGVELDGKTVGIIGYGNNGSALARKLRGFEVNVLAYDKYKSGFGDEYVQEVELDRIYKEADVISLHIPQTKETLGLINAEFINRMEKPFYLVNLARGKVMETEALVAGLKSEKVKGAVLDVLEYESKSFEQWLRPDNTTAAMKYLQQAPNVILTPHVGGWTQESYFKLSNVLADKVLSKW